MMHATLTVHLSRTVMIVGSALVACSPTEPSDFLDARISLEEDEVTAGSFSVARVEVTNHGSDPIEIEVEVCPPRILVYDRRGNQVGQPPVPCPLILSAPVAVDPGETQAWAQGWFAPASAGVYRIQAWVAPVGGGFPVLTNRATVTVQ